MRCIISALTKIALVGIVAVSTVRAQQSGPASTEPVDQIATPVRPRKVPRFIYPLAMLSMGCQARAELRYLLRNGLDYLSYGEYQRAFKFLRETESRKNELNDAEILLQKSIESAQRGLREAADAESSVCS